MQPENHRLNRNCLEAISILMRAPHIWEGDARTDGGKGFFVDGAFIEGLFGEGTFRRGG